MSGPMGLVYETPGDPSTADLWGTALNASLVLVENHDHTPGKGSLIKAASLGIDGDTSWAGYALTLAKAITFASIAPSSVVSYSNALFTSSSDNNLYFRNSSGTNVQITAGAQLNLSAVGGIGGDYAAVSALVDFTDATHAYGLHQQVGGGVRQYGKLWTGDVSLFEFKVNGTAGVPSQAVTLKSPTALAASYAVTWPAAAAAGGSQLLAIDSAGVMTNNGVLGNNVNVQLQGTGHILRGDRATTVVIGPTPSFNASGGGATNLSGHPGAGVPASSSNSFPINFPDADNSICLVQSVVVAMAVTTANCTFTLQFNTPGIGLSNVAGASVVKTPGGAATLTLTPTTPLDITGGGLGATLWLNVAPAATSVTEVYSAIIHTTIAT